MLILTPGGRQKKPYNDKFSLQNERRIWRKDAMSINVLEKKELEAAINILLTTEGSTTKAIENLVGQDVTIEVYDQEVVLKNELPKEISKHFFGSEKFLKRTSTLKIGKQNVSHNIVYASVDLLPAEFVQKLRDGNQPIGRIIQDLGTNRNILSAQFKNIQPYRSMLHKATLVDATYPVKEYKILKGDFCLFYIFELFEETCILGNLK